MLLFVGNQQETTVCEDVKDIFNSFAREKILNKTASPSIHVGTEGDVVCSLFRKKVCDEKKEKGEKSGSYMIICYLCTRIEEKSTMT